MATFNADLTREGPGLLLRDIRTAKDPQVEAAAGVIAAAAPDVILLTGIDYDLDGVALAAFAAVNPANVASALQYDYCAAYLAFFSDEPQRARAIALKHANHPVDRWRNAFAAIISPGLR